MRRLASAVGRVAIGLLVVMLAGCASSYHPPSSASWGYRGMLKSGVSLVAYAPSLAQCQKTPAKDLSTINRSDWDGISECGRVVVNAGTGWSAFSIVDVPGQPARSATVPRADSSRESAGRDRLMDVRAGLSCDEVLAGRRDGVRLAVGCNIPLAARTPQTLADPRSASLAGQRPQGRYIHRDHLRQPGGLSNSPQCPN